MYVLEYLYQSRSYISTGVISTIPNAIGMAFHVLWYIHSSLNPLIFLLTLPDFKEEARKLLKVRHSAAVNPKDSIGNSL